MTAPVLADTLSRLKSVLGEGGWSEDQDRIAPKLVEWRGRWQGQTPLLVLPRTVTEVSAVIGICAASGTAVTPQGGNTGLVSGQIPQGEILLSTERMTTIRDVDPVDDVAVAEAGVTLATLHEAVAHKARRFPIGLASEGSATVGGIVSTNAGGTQVLRYGNTRNLVLGLEAVLPNGEIWNGLGRLRKDNTGYDLKQLLIGAEGTLGVVTAASLKLFPQLVSRSVAICGVSSPAQALRLLTRAKAESGGAIEAFELMSRLGVTFAIKNIFGVREPLEAEYPWYVLVELASGESGASEAAMERLLSLALDDEIILDAAIAQSDSQIKAFWAVRENQSGGQRPEGAAWKHDVSVPVSSVATFIERASAAVSSFCPGVRIVAFGHLGDGNIHYDVLKAEGAPDSVHNDLRDQGSRIVHDIVAQMQGSISAEHGLGSMKTLDALRYKSQVEVEALKAIRGALDPARIMNPRVLF
jgi:FAD/FMN-containing dehydrogenase